MTLLFAVYCNSANCKYIIVNKFNEYILIIKNKYNVKFTQQVQYF